MYAAPFAPASLSSVSRAVRSSLVLVDGTVNACSVLSGLLFYREYQYMNAGQIVASLCGLIVVISGVAVSIRSNLSCCSKKQTGKVTPMAK